MSQMVTRKGPVGEDKDKRQTTSPVKEMKKKLAANAEKEKQAAEKNAEKSQADKKIDKVNEKIHSDKKADKVNEKPQNEKKVEKVTDKQQNEKKVEKVTDKSQNEKKAEKAAEKQSEKKTEKVEKVAEKSDKKEKIDKNVDKKDKTEKNFDKKEVAADKKEIEKAVEKKEKASDKKETAATEKVKEDSNKDKAGKQSEAECSEPKPKEPVAAASVVACVASVANVSNGVNGDATNGDTVSSSEDEDRDEMFPELAYDDSDGDFEPPTPEGRSYTRRSQVKSARTPETPRPASDKRDDESKILKLKEDTPLSDRKLRSSGSPKKNDTKIILEEPKECELALDADVNVDGARVKLDTNYARSRVKVSPYRRPRPDDSSLLADYTGNNSTMEMDVTESSWSDGSYLSGLRAIRARRSYRDAPRDAHAHAHGASSEAPIRPTGTVVGRKRRPEGEGPAPGTPDDSKRPRLLDRLSRPFRVTATLPVRTQPEIVGINTDLPLSAPVSSESFDPEALKPGAPEPPRPDPPHRDGRRCVLM